MTIEQAMNEKDTEGTPNLEAKDWTPMQYGVIPTHPGSSSPSRGSYIKTIDRFGGDLSLDLAPTLFDLPDLQLPQMRAVKP